ncbi:myosin-9-like isoform X1 [Olea europaea subsp. europaea]|uniref:Myosin-9-like isoform X1 n=1 Tax=Olea europaea subsp. europaea TaxID=158383 RepID=A0A8S0PZU5_OLEEU|nr:myosin-9-like isoform X1 [Olea europaea subsp. europaea]
MLLCAPTNLRSTPGLVAREHDDSFTSSDTASSDSDFSFPAPVSTLANLSSFNPDAFQLIVQDLSAAENSDEELSRFAASCCLRTVRLEEKLTNLESENKVLRQQALAIAQNNKLLSSISRSILQDLPSA